MNKLANLEPQNVFRYFEEICGIPHGSGNMEAISNYCMEFAKEHNLKARQDEAWNVVIVKEATAGYEAAPTVMLQSHLDMVCEKLDSCELDFTKDGLELVVEGDFISANGTTLGGDNGIAVAMMLAILSDDSLTHPRLECVFTVDEEIGLLGAGALDTSDLQAKRMINLDSEEEGIFTVSCAGGMRKNCFLPLTWQETEGVRYTLTIDGLLGGHSGVEIHKEHGNSNKLMGRLLNALDEKVNFLLRDLHGGLADNAIPRRTDAVVYVKEDETELFEEVLAAYQKIYKNEFASNDPDVKISYTKEGLVTGKTLTPKCQSMLLFLLHIVPNGVQRMSADIEGLVQTSLNLGILEMNDENACISFSIRSSVESEKDELSALLSQCAEFLGGSAEESGEYPGWEYKKDSVLRDTMLNVYKDQFQKDAKVVAIHAGLECGLFSGRMEGLDCVSIGPEMHDIHTPQEHLSISSTKRTYEFILAVLKELK